MPGRVLVVASTKGGAGKTTAAACLAAHWHRGGRAVGLLDADPRGLLASWRNAGRGAEIPLVADADERSIMDTIDGLAAQAEIVIVDAAGYGNQAAVYAIGSADAVLIPVGASAFDIACAFETKEIVDRAVKLTRREIPALALLARVQRRTVVTRHSVSEMQRGGLDVMTSYLPERTYFKEMTFNGTAPAFDRPKGQIAREVGRIATELETPLLPARAA